MVHIIADPSWSLVDLADFVEIVEISDPNGKLLGVFVPANLERGKEMYALLAAQTDWAEIERRKQSKEKGRTTREVFEHLLTLATDEQDRVHLKKLIDQVAERDQCTATQ